MVNTKKQRGSPQVVVYVIIVGALNMNNDSIESVKILLDRVISTFSNIELGREHLPTFQLRDAELKLRRVRDRYFPDGYFGGSIWDILLELDRAERCGRKYAVSDVGIDSRIPNTTALRYLMTLEADGMIAREQDPNDRRRTHVKLTAKCRAAINQSFNDTIGNMPPQHETGLPQLHTKNG
jgi:DNA-binding MarR family transcriptional regulator